VGRFAITGVVRKEEILYKNNSHLLKPGDSLIITKPIGSGVLLAGNMRNQVDGTNIERMLESMLLSNKKAASIARKHESKGITDVTGFGFMGHLVEMIKSSTSIISVDIYLDEVPIFEGASECVRNDVSSSLFLDNFRVSRLVNNSQFALENRPHSYPILFDPQTSGGLIIIVPQETAVDCLEELKGSGYPDSRMVGQISKRLTNLEIDFDIIF